MELKKSTILSALVCVSGLLAELIFHDTMLTSDTGVTGFVLAIVLGIVVVTAAYFTADGIYKSIQTEEKPDEEAVLKERAEQEEYRQRMYSVMSELLQFQKAVYKEVRVLQDKTEEQQPIEDSPLGQSIFELRQEVSQIADSVSYLGDKMTKMPTVSEIQAVLDQVKGLSGDMEEVKEELSEFPGTMEEVKANLSELPAAIDAVKESVTELPNTVADLQNKLSELPNDILSAQEERIEALQAEVSQQFAKLTEQVDILEQRLTASDDENQEPQVTQESLEQLKQDISDANMQTAKVIVRYVSQNCGEIKELIEQNKWPPSPNKFKKPRKENPASKTNAGK